MDDGPRTRAWQERLYACLKTRPDGRHYVETQELASLVREEPGLAAAAAQSMLKMGPYGRGWLQMALAIAALYEIEFGDDSLNLVVRQGLDELGLGDLSPEVLPLSGEAEASGVSGIPHMLRFDVAAAQLAKVDIYPLVKAFSVVGLASSAQLAQLGLWKGRIVLTFPVPAADSREVWEVPEVRAFVRAVADAMPYFPYFLSTRPGDGMFAVYFGCLADPSSVQHDGISIYDENVVIELCNALVSVRRLCAALGEDGDVVAAEILSGCPDDYVTTVLGLVEKLDTAAS